MSNETKRVLFSMKDQCMMDLFRGQARVLSSLLLRLVVFSAVEVLAVGSFSCVSPRNSTIYGGTTCIIGDNLSTGRWLVTYGWLLLRV